MAKESPHRLWRNGWRRHAADHQPPGQLWEAILPAEALGLPAELTRVDQLLEDPAFIQPFRAHFDPRCGRPWIPIDSYLRRMFLKHRYGLGDELLCREVADSISWQRFCRIPLGGRVPHPTTLVKRTRRVGEQTVERLNQLLLERAAEGNCCAPTGFGSTPPWSPRTWPTRPIWGCWLARSTSW
jgi:IS5 family transposase